jgi:hypothetical protein
MSADSKSAPTSVGGCGGNGEELRLNPEPRLLGNGRSFAVPLAVRNGMRALPFNVSTLISRGLQRFLKNMRKLLKMKELCIKLQVFDFSPVRKKKAVFRPVSHP